mmetsp:Transcript_23431/g.44490  ORF Transcript_23431/g.44490 Transcript_23431/m.44490 type:complete len:102 (-) Transcript_23431:291-596(-)
MATWKYLQSVCTVFQRNGGKTHPGKEASTLKIHQQNLRGCGKLQVNGSPGTRERSLLLKSLTIQKWEEILDIKYYLTVRMMPVWALATLLQMDNINLAIKV